eukprot:COSAG05_NODE_1406_length_4967_cov_7.938180_4_plen_188_part_00
MTPFVCVGVAKNASETIFSLEFDPLVPNVRRGRVVRSYLHTSTCAVSVRSVCQILYAGTRSGTILLARIHADRRNVNCRVVGRLHERPQVQEGEPELEPEANALRLATVKGHLFVTSVRDLVVYNTSRMHADRHGVVNRQAFARPHTNDPLMFLRDLPLLAIDRQQEKPFLVLCSGNSVCVAFHVQL